MCDRSGYYTSPHNVYGRLASVVHVQVWVLPLSPLAVPESVEQLLGVVHLLRHVVHLVAVLEEEGRAGLPRHTTTQARQRQSPAAKGRACVSRMSSRPASLRHTLLSSSGKPLALKLFFLATNCGWRQHDQLDSENSLDSTL